MNAEVTNSFDRLESYLGRARTQMAAGNRAQALADLAELAEIARRLWMRVYREREDPA